MAPARLSIVDAALFPLPKPSYGVNDFERELIWLPKGLDPRGARPEDCVPCLFLTSPSARFFVLYLHSNAEDLGRCYKFCSLMRHFFHVSVLAVEYPGYGICPGRADEESVVENARVALRFLLDVLRWPLDGVLIFGRSVGCGPALALAVEEAVYGLVLVCPFTSVRELCRDFVGHAADLIGERFPNLERVVRVRSPLLLVHGRKDSMVSVEHGRALYEACRTRKHFVSPEHMDHNAYLYADSSYLVMPLMQFFSLPDYDFGELLVPEWVFDKHLCPLYSEESEAEDRTARLERQRRLAASLKQPADGPPACPAALGAGRAVVESIRSGPLSGRVPVKESQAEVASLPESERSTTGSEEPKDPQKLEDLEDEVLPTVALEALVARPAAHPRFRAKDSDPPGAAAAGRSSPSRSGAGDRRHVEFFGTVLSGRPAEDLPEPPDDPSPTLLPASCTRGPQLGSFLPGPAASRGGRRPGAAKPAAARHAPEDESDSAEDPSRTCL